MRKIYPNAVARVPSVWRRLRIWWNDRKAEKKLNTLLKSGNPAAPEAFRRWVEGRALLMLLKNRSV